MQIIIAILILTNLYTAYSWITTEDSRKKWKNLALEARDVIIRMTEIQNKTLANLEQKVALIEKQRQNSRGE